MKDFKQVKETFIKHVELLPKTSGPFFWISPSNAANFLERLTKINVGTPAILNATKNPAYKGDIQLEIKFILATLEIADIDEAMLSYIISHPQQISDAAARLTKLPLIVEHYDLIKKIEETANKAEVPAFARQLIHSLIIQQPMTLPQINELSSFIKTEMKKDEEKQHEMKLAESSYVVVETPSAKRQ